MNILINILINALAVFITSYILPGVHLNNFGTAVLVALLLSIANAVIRPILIILTLPVTILTLGLFTFVINALMILLVDAFVDGFSVDGFLWALLFSLILSVVSSVLRSMTS